ncbi:MAG: DUF4159 domain-containing protein [Planctomycetaceae bacterium]|jgi:hypothetical protein|nr:DUF4159 domain-containing protein [Planctomycetaceae bacterium]
MRIFLLNFLGLGIFIFPVFGQDLDPNEVRLAIEQGVQFLKRTQKTHGNWDEHASSGERCGATALAILALVSCGVPKDDPAIQRGMKYLRLFSGKEAGRNYSISLQTMAFCAVDPERDRPLIRNNIALLERNQIHGNSEHNGGWYYTPWEGNSGSSDLSNSQFSILALYEAERLGISVKTDTWLRAQRYWEQSQNPNNAWGYNPRPGGGSNDTRGSMSCAGIASLIITSGILDTGTASVRGDKIFCFQQPNHRIAVKIKKGLSWLASNFSVSQNPHVGNWLYYYLYALERVGRMTNQRFIGQHDWYREGADKILRLRDPIDGAWRGQGTGDTSSTAFALLFLSKGRRPVLMSKVQYGETDSWNLHPNDVNKLTVFTESRWNIDLTWQIINIQAATVDHLLQSPVLYFSGDQTLLQQDDAGTARMAEKLRDYIDQGGFIIAEAQSNDKTFDNGFRELMKQVFPEPGYELELLERSHPIWTAEIPIEPDQLRPIEGIHFGCRTSVVYIPPFKDPQTDQHKPSLSCLWEISRIFNRGESYHETVQKQVDAGLGIGLNILAYATNRELKFKDQIAESVTQKASTTDSRRGRVFLTFLDTGGAMNPAPHAPLNLLLWLETNLGLPVVQQIESINPASENLYENPVLFMHGRTAFQFSPEQQKNLKEHLNRGGFLFVNAICSSRSFSDSFHREMQTMFPETTFQAIPLDDPLFSDEYGGFKIKTLDVRLPEQSPGRKIVAPVRQEVPKLYGLKLEEEDRWVVVFSPYDVSCALERANSLECRGYTQDSAMQLSVNILLYALEHW